jgi:hypothetical protein
MKHRLMLLGLMLCAVLWAGCNSSSNPSEGGSSGALTTVQAALTAQAMSAAMQKATSWRMTMKSGAMEMSMDVQCPDKSHTATKTGAMAMEMVRIGPDMYTKTGAKWMKMPTSGAAPPVCGAAMGGVGAGGGGGASGGGGGNGGSGKMPSLDVNVKLTKGGTETVNGETCTDWTATVTDAKGQHTTTMCVGDDKLPRQMKSGDMVITWSNWNKTTVEAPKM